MHPKAQQLLDAHVAYSLAQLSGENLKTTVGREAGLAYQWLANQNTEDIAPKEKVKAILERLLQEISITEATQAYFESLYKAILDYVAKEDIEIDDLISEATWKRIVEKVIEQKDLRNELIHRLVSNKFYGEMLSEILYNSIKSFMQQSVPGSDKGIGGLFNVGKGILGAALSGMEDTIDKNVKKFLSENINKTIRDSEKIIQSRLTDANIRKGADKLWEVLDDINFKELADKAKKYSSQGKESLGDISTAIIHDVRDSKALRHIGDVVLDHFYNEYGQQKLGVIFNNLLITEDKVVREVTLAAEDIVGRMLATGYLEGRLREVLEKFYASDEVSKILS
jgi:uncharacterized membrane-anchored protein YjiN (DUF445 family)